MRLVLCLLLLFGAQALAQRPPRAYFPWWESPLTKSLNLSEAQQEQIRDVLRDYRTKLIDQRAAVEKAEGEFEDLFNNPAINSASASQAIDRLVEARSALTRTFTQMSLDLRQVLTYEQWRQLEEKRSKWESMRPRRMPGGANSPREGHGPRGAGGQQDAPPPSSPQDF